MSTFLQFLLAGIMIGVVYSVVAVGFVLIYKASGIFNIAQGQLVAIGAFLCWEFLNALGLHPVLAIVLTLAAGFIIGWLLSIFPFGRVLGESMFSLFVVALALMIFLQGVIIAFWGAHSIMYLRSFISPRLLRFGGLSVYYQDIFGFALAVLLLIVFWVFFRYAKLGLAFRAVSEDSVVARSLGISLKRITALALGFGGAVAALGGVVLGMKYGIDVGVADLAMGALAAVLVGGMESITGAVLGGLLIGVVYSLTSYYIGHSIGSVSMFLAMIAVLLIRPYGLLGQKRIERV